ncbi:MAG: universal stress protein [Gammaproteobacteria bacterium]|nr:universal stress protein [Gammaproteobacteria bacterium]MDH5619152.1 universal stress protein [Gammaproteobacteria bacterium]
MGNSKAILADSRKEVREHAIAARRDAKGGVILVPVDFSDHSKAALLQAAEYAQVMRASLVVLHVVHDPGEMPGYYSKLIKKKRATRIQDMAADAFDHFMEETSEEHPKLESLRNSARLMVRGLPVTRILEVVDYLEPMMVVMGSQGRTGLKHLVMGSKAAQIVQLCPVPVTIVKKKASVD